MAGKRPIRDRVLPGWVYFTPLIGLWAFPVVVVLLCLPGARLAESASLEPARAQLSTVGARESTYRQAVDIALAYPEDVVLTVPRGGVVTMLATTIGLTPNTGDPVVSMDGDAVFAIHGETPLFRDLRRGDTGPDVVTLTGFLATMGELTTDEVDEQFGPATERAVQRFQRSTGQESDGVFKRSSTLFIPPGMTRVTAVLPQLGSALPAGAPLLTVRGQASALAFTVSGSTDVRPQPPQGTLVLDVGGQTVPLPGLDIPVESIDDIGDVLSGALPSGVISELAGETSTRTFTGAFLMVNAPQRVGAVPGSSIFVTPEGTTCLFIQPPEGEAQAVPVDSTLISGEIGQAAVPQALIGQRFHVDPMILADAVRDSCAS